MECAAQFPEKVVSLALMGGAGEIPMNPELLDLAEKGDPKAVQLMMDWAHGPAGHFGGHPVPGLFHLNLGGTIVENGSIKDTLGVDFRACDNYKNGFESAKKIKCPTINILGDKDHNSVKHFAEYILSLNIKNFQNIIISDAGHYYKGKISSLATQVNKWLKLD